MKSIAVAAVALLLTAAPAHAAKEQLAAPVVASGAIAGSSVASTKCIRGREIGSNRIKRVCLPEDQLKRLSKDEIADLMRSDKTAAELLAP